MQVIPAINARSQEEAAALMGKARSFLKLGAWLHFDVSVDNPSGLSRMMNDESRMMNFNMEVHFMTPQYEELLQPWLEAGAKRIIVQAEILKNLEFLLETARKFGAEAGLSVAPETAVEELNVYFNKVNFFQVLAVNPGKSGQQFQSKVVPKIQWLREQKPDAIIEVDGGITLETAGLAREAGADIIVSASYIFGSTNPAQAYGELTR